ncbi:MAG: hypothetical protein FI688_05200 [SAR202 cluster bacterium]|nr:hypothetical protein [SAR202 cluster bacterium]
MKSNNKNTSSYIFVDSSLAIDFLRDKKLYQEARIITASPYLLNLESDTTISFESEENESLLSNLIESGLEFSTNVFDSLNNTSFSDYALLSALQVHNLQKWVRKSINLEINHFNDSVLVVQIVDNNGNLITAYDNKIAQLLSNNSNLQTLSLNIEDIIDDRFQISKLEKYKEIKKRALAKFNRIKNNLPNINFNTNTASDGIIANYPSRNHLLVDISYELQDRGYQIEQLIKYNVRKSPYNSNKYADIFERLNPIVTKHVSSFVNERAIQPLIEIYYRNLFDAFQEYDAQISNWEHQIDKINPEAVMSSFPARPDMIALSKVCNVRSIPYISAQHGFGREVDKLHKVSVATYENSVADLVLTYNHTSAEILNKHNPFKKGIAIPVGFPSHVRDQIGFDSKSIMRSNQHEIIYISNMLFMGNAQMIHVGTASDSIKSNFDINLLSVFENINKNVLFKLYPITHIDVDPQKSKYKSKRLAPNRYLDLNPISEIFSKLQNVTMYDGTQDALKMFKNHKIIVLAGCSTSLGNALISNIPLVYINSHKIRPMQEEVLREFSEAVFCFDAEDKKFNDTLKNFLNSNIEEINRLWNQKSNSREKFILKYVDSSDSSLDIKNAASSVTEFINIF